MNNDLISRSDLKDRLAKHQPILDFEWDNNNLIASIIDNAPTVEVPTYTDLIEANKEGYNNARRLYERPQGEWIDPQNVGANNWCSVCGKFILHYDGICNYCSNCGADMRGKKNETDN